MRKVVAVQSGLSSIAQALDRKGYDVRSLYDVVFANQYVHAVVYSGRNPDNEVIQAANNYTFSADMHYDNYGSILYIDAHGRTVDEVVDMVVQSIGDPLTID